MAIPDRTLKTLEKYVKDGIPTGDFLFAVLTNNLTNAVLRADEGNLAAIREIMLYVYNEVPSEAWGTEEKVKAWLKKKAKEMEGD